MRIHFMAFCALGILFVSPLAHATPAIGPIKAFYKAYLNYRGTDRAQGPKAPLSTSFRNLITENTDACQKKAGSDVCGWGADGDVYLDSQEVDPKLNYRNSKIEFNEPKPGTIEVKLNVYPSAKNTKVYAKTITYKMIVENDKWVIDDILAHGKSARHLIRSEIEFLQKKK